MLRPATLRVDRGDVDDPPALAAAHHGAADDLGADEGAGEVQVHQLAPARDPHVADRRRVAPPADIVDQDVERPVRGERSPAGRLADAGIAHVGLDRPGLPAECPDIGGGALEARGIAAGQRDVGAGVGDRKRHLAPEPAAAAGDEKPPAGQAEPVQHAHPGSFLLATGRRRSVPARRTPGLHDHARQSGAIGFPCRSKG